MSANISIGGLISGIDTNSMLDQLYQVAQAPINRLQSRKEALNQKSVAWSQFEALLLSFRTLSVQLATPAGFELCSAAVSHSDLVTASVGSNAVPGTYTFTIQALAQTHQIVSQGYADTDVTEVGSGTISITVGEADPVVVDVDNFTLEELRDAINGSSAGVRAAIIDDGGGASPYRLVLTSETSGTVGEMDVTVDLTGGTAPTFFSDMQPAQDAQIQLGSGAGAITISSSSNTVSGAIPGVTLNLLAADPATPVTLTVARDEAAIQARIEDLVAAYNEVVDFFADQFYFDSETGHMGTLFGDFRLQGLQQDLARSLGNAVVGATGEFHSLSELGVRVQSTGKLSVDTSTLAGALASNFEDVIALFAAVGRTTHSDVSFLTGTSDTQPSGAAGWAVEITQVATQTRVTAGVAQTEALAADETLTINGVNVSLSAGMTQSEVVDAVNAMQDQTGVVASATNGDGQGTGNYLTLTRLPYGSAYHIQAVSTASNQGGGNTSGVGTTTVTEENPAGESGTGTGAAGLDVEGTIGGQECEGAGRRLTANAGDPEGAALLITGTSTGSYGYVYFTVGAAEAAFRVCLSATDTVDGTIARAQDYLDDTMDEIDEEIARLQELIDKEQERLRASFVAMERALAQFESQSQFLANQIAQMQANAVSG